jgi:molecular chaperone GrpE (heat shock protein)
LERAIGAPPATATAADAVDSNKAVPETSPQLLQLHKTITQHEPEVMHSFVSGIPLIQSRLVRSLAAHNVARVDPSSGDVFNPDLHEACATVPGEKGAFCGS